ncbi:hypothetical protein FDP41_001875 [Naegleria fowleri]|uniref:Uncharacterized protein n=1 Tax=Naegleria fowleri TaxID=5763 RepID=A0A6A5BZP0_NAEFO|nr:uncharacterized protein FDP41_001875 [Naegleria fowleri]KAF0978805.1 hypothetical protein FDP41_001875 [Naegleria fowleri]CAG4717978.1 unnamed protein product [Naegleria fowleri]
MKRLRAFDGSHDDPSFVDQVEDHDEETLDSKTPKSLCSKFQKKDSVPSGLDAKWSSLPLLLADDIPKYEKSCARISKQWLSVVQSISVVLDFTQDPIFDLETLKDVVKCSFLNVTSLNLCGNEIGNTGIKILVNGEPSSVLKNLTELNLKGNNIFK